MSESSQNDELSRLKSQFKDTIYSFIDTCIPLGTTDNHMHFLSMNGQLYGFDLKKNTFFEPNTSIKYSLINNCINMYFTDKIKHTLEEKVGVKFEDMVELLLRFNYKEKHIGKKFFFCKTHNIIYIWSMMNSEKWETADVDTFKYLFSNNDILQDETKVYKSTKVTSFEDLGIDMDDLEEISARFKDGSIHYKHKTTNKIYSLNILKNFWYVPNEDISRRIMAYMNKSDEATVDKICNI